MTPDNCQNPPPEKQTTTVWDKLISQENLVSQLRHNIISNTIAHAWLFTGPPGSGRSTAARAFAAALQCEQHQQENRGCGQCHPCRATLNHTHPDVTIVDTDKVIISINQVRSLVTTAQDAPNNGKWRIIIIEDADRMQEKTTNVLLKALEEPPPRTIWILCVPNPEDIPITIRSRCRKATLVTPEPQKVAELLTKQEGINPDEALQAARLSQCHIGVARRLAHDQQARERREYIVSLPLKLNGVSGAFHLAQKLLDTAATENAATTQELNEREKQELLTTLGEKTLRKPTTKAEIRRLEENQKRRATRNKRDALDRYLIDLQSLYRDILLTQLYPENNNYVNPHLNERINLAAHTTTAEQTLAKIDAITEARKKITNNTDPLLTLEAMAVKLL